MSNKHLHIVSFDVPYPPNYGGVIDVFYKIKALHDLGVKIHLHTFEYGRGKRAELNAVCENITYYKRKTGIAKLFSKLPYVVASRQSDELLKNLSLDDYPVLFEGLHCCYYLNHPNIANKIRLVRSHNIEHDYYAGLALSEKNVFKKWYFNSEAKKLKTYESVYSRANCILAISEKDRVTLSKKYSHVHYVPAFHANEKINSRTGKGTFVLYHGNLSVAENNAAALFLVSKVFKQLPDVKLIIAGNGPKQELENAIKGQSHIELKKNISVDEINHLIQEAQINILPTFQATGLKLKLLTALYNGRHCIVNKPMVEETGLESLCYVKNSNTEMAEAVKQLMTADFTLADIQKREAELYIRFSNKTSAKKIIDYL